MIVNFHRSLHAPCLAAIIGLLFVGRQACSADVVIREVQTMTWSRGESTAIVAYNTNEMRTDTYRPTDRTPVSTEIDNFKTSQSASIDWKDRTTFVQPKDLTAPPVAHVTATDQYKTILGYRARLYIDRYGLATDRGDPRMKETQDVWAAEALPDYPGWQTKAERTRIRGTPWK